jgi:hypothetical protein
MAEDDFPHSRSKIDGAGKTIRHSDREGKDLLEASLELVDEFRIGICRPSSGSRPTSPTTSAKQWDRPKSGFQSLLV